MRTASVVAATVTALAIGCLDGDQRRASCVPAEIFSVDRDQYCVRPAAGTGNYVMVSTWPDLVVQIYCEYGGWPDRKAAVLDGCDRIAQTLRLDRS